MVQYRNFVIRYGTVRYGTVVSANRLYILLQSKLQYGTAYVSYCIQTYTVRYGTVPYGTNVPYHIVDFSVFGTGTYGTVWYG